jgi:hypothetical protein
MHWFTRVYFCLQTEVTDKLLKVAQKILGIFEKNSYWKVAKNYSKNTEKSYQNLPKVIQKLLSIYF